ncbi:Gfo/Idh/MocA family oxidoreductase [Alsobacter sp. SYSU M60028]|uniref:Gfo/Idh/MocA family oxidoreductase n=1 Tax=Alsobacter ponti TaxID=2962936 RepID=A0ABT1LH40_9HYPH|nr:Gfo/Idh/MocA family oxidoreductase [Alsobacter ponti]MCP8939558.1 Gfo/Idh/MocA family oxidoreductase [Alsobacter ponti]
MTLPCIARPHRVAIVGLGMAHKPHLQGLRDLAPTVSIAACYAPSPERRAAFAAANPDLAIVDSLDKALGDPSVDTVLVLTPPATHLELVKRCAEAGKHVLLEKPVETQTGKAAELVAAMERAGRKLGIMFQMRFRPASLRLASVIAAGELGELVSASARVRWWRTAEYYAQPGRGMKARDGGGVLLTQAIHTLDLFQSLTGPIVEVSGFAATSKLRRIDTEDVAGAAVRFANGAIGTIDATTVAYPGFPETIEWAGSKATAVLTNKGLDVFWQDGRREEMASDVGAGGGADPMAFSHESHRDCFADLLQAIDEGREPRVSGREALKVHRLIDAILASSEQRRAVAIETD